MVRHKGDLRRRNPSRVPGHELHCTRDAVSASPPRCLQQVHDASIGQELDSSECEGRAGAVPHEPLAPLIVIRCDALFVMRSNGGGLPPGLSGGALGSPGNVTAIAAA
jgi:hypothetical protein